MYPSRIEYDIAVQNFDKLISASNFKGGKPKPLISKNSSGLLKSYAGGYSIVYPIQVENRTRALRCWTKDPGNIKVRYAEANKYLAVRSLPYFVEFGYIEKAICVNNVWHPISYMDWIDGDTLSDFIDAHIQSSSLLREVAKKFVGMVRELHEHNISHGDLQDGNIMICTDKNSVELKLVDYDSLYVPSLQGLLNDELPGVPHYQHPRRAKQKSNDPVNHKNRDVFKTLGRLSDPIPTLAYKLKEFCHEQDTNQLSPLEQIVPLGSVRKSSAKRRSGNNGGTDAFNDFFGQSPISRTSPKSRANDNPDKKPDRNEFNDYFKQPAKQQTTPKTKPQSKPAPRSSSQQDSGWGGAISIIILIIAAILILTGSC